MAQPLLITRFPPEHFMPSANWQDASPADGRFQSSRLSTVVSYWDPEDATSAAKRQQLADRLQNFAKDWLHNTLVLPQFAGFQENKICPACIDMPAANRGSGACLRLV
ncbi:hypothetical protein WJX73_007737 [Symbiochloris irregularis]|uniref:Uncharacterized protein n=1 Tax=Symbiochloris irregularis TaxID=706552 RepID=A0AAW1NSV8_9CHLO